MYLVNVYIRADKEVKECRRQRWRGDFITPITTSTHGPTMLHCFSENELEEKWDAIFLSALYILRINKSHYRQICFVTMATFRSVRVVYVKNFGTIRKFDVSLELWSGAAVLENCSQRFSDRENPFLASCYACTSLFNVAARAYSPFWTCDLIEDDIDRHRQQGTDYLN